MTLPQNVKDAVKFANAECGKSSDFTFDMSGADWQTIRAHLLSQDAELKILRVKCSGTLANNLCPDHRDKQVGNPCLACTIEKLQSRLAAANERLEAAERDAARWRFFCDNIGGGYGDGYTEPREQYASLEWQQGPWIYDGSNDGRGRADTFPGWSAIIDRMMEEEKLALKELDEPIDAATQEGEG